MDMQTMMAIAFGVVAVLVLAWLIVRKPPTTIDEAQAQIAQAAEMAKTLVMAAEQLYRTGKLPADGRFAFVRLARSALAGC
jgi:F0F1-type ATP synthase membrane subunit b/b'